MNLDAVFEKQVQRHTQRDQRAALVIDSDHQPQEEAREELEGERSMRKYGKWVLSFGLLAATPGLNFAAGPNSKDANSSVGTRAPRVDNQRMADSIANALRHKVHGEITIEYRDGVAVLGGSVVDQKIKQKASELAAKVPGVSKVDNRIAVNANVTSRKQSIADRLRGEIDSPENNVIQANHAGDMPKTARVQQVNAEVAQAGPPIPTGVTAPQTPAQTPSQLAPATFAPATASNGNQEIAEQIGAALTTAQLDGYDIQIHFQRGVCTLDGSVGTAAERANASKVVQSIPGVQSVSNRLRTLEQPPAQYASATPTGGYAPQQGGYAPQGDPRMSRMPQYAPAQPGMPGQYPIQQASAQGMQGGPPAPGPGYGAPNGGAMPMGPGGAPPYPPTYGSQGAGASQAVYNSPSLPEHAWPSYAQYPNSAAVSYPQQYSASAWPYIGPFYPYPQVPLGWRDATLRWDDGQWNLMFRPRTDRWWWFMNPNNW